jgi:tetratricopeptide (TPR) repeat protein
MEHFQVAQRLYTEHGDVPEQAMNLHNLVAVFQALDMPEQALTHARLALELSEEVDDRQRQAIALNNLGWMYSNDGDQAAAIDCPQRALPILSDLGDDLPRSSRSRPRTRAFAAEVSAANRLDYSKRARGDCPGIPMSSDSAQRQMGRQAGATGAIAGKEAR